MKNNDISYFDILNLEAQATEIEIPVRKCEQNINFQNILISASDSIYLRVSAGEQYLNI